MESYVTSSFPSIQIQPILNNRLAQPQPNLHNSLAHVKQQLSPCCTIGQPMKHNRIRWNTIDGANMIKLRPSSKFQKLNGVLRHQFFSFYTNLAHAQLKVSPTLAHPTQQLSPCSTIAQPMLHNRLAHGKQKNPVEHNRYSKYQKVCFQIRDQMIYILEYLIGKLYYLGPVKKKYRKLF